MVFDVDIERIKELKNNHDKTGEISSNELAANQKINFTSNVENICDADVYIVTVPTPIDNAKRPDINPIKKACQSIGNSIKKERN